MVCVLPSLEPAWQWGSVGSSETADLRPEMLFLLSSPRLRQTHLLWASAFTTNSLADLAGCSDATLWFLENRAFSLQSLHFLLSLRARPPHLFQEAFPEPWQGDSCPSSLPSYLQFF